MTKHHKPESRAEQLLEQARKAWKDADARAAANYLEFLTEEGRTKRRITKAADELESELHVNAPIAVAKPFKL